MVSTFLRARVCLGLGLSCTAIAALILLIGTGHATADAQQVRIELAAPAPETVWRHADEGAPCAPNDYADVPVRPFLVKGAASGNYGVLWFAANSQGYFASETPGPDLAPSDVTLARFRRLPDCARWVRSQPYIGSTPEPYNTGLWMVAPFTGDGTNVYALVHNEFHGEWTGSPHWCGEQRPQIYLPCNYWNLVSASSADGGQHFALRQSRPDWNVPAIALPAPYVPNWIGPHPVPQGIAAQTNMIEQNGFVYVLAQQLATTSLVLERDNGGMCLFRAPVPLNVDTVWQGWAGAESGWIDLPASYPTATNPPPCAKVLPGAFRFSWSYNPTLQQFILLGLVSSPSNQPTCPPADPTVGQSDTAFVYMTATADLPNGQFTVVTRQTCLLRINWLDHWGRSWPDKIGSAYPSLLDPMSPSLNRGASIDLNFQYSGTQPYLYYTKLNAYAPARVLNDRDVVRWKLSVSRDGAGAPQ
jgi:hypothetical protein